MKSYFIDTNYILRLLLADDKKQFERVYLLFQEASKGKVRLFTSVIVFFEVYWVLSSFYNQKKRPCIDYLKKILRMDFLEIETKEILVEAVGLFEKSALSLEDCFNVFYVKQFPGSEFATFDKKVLKYAS